MQLDQLFLSDDRELVLEYQRVLRYQKTNDDVQVVLYLDEGVWLKVTRGVYLYRQLLKQMFLLSLIIVLLLEDLL
jgi:hypothetical protein